MSKGQWRGVALEDYSKDELIDIVLESGKMLQENFAQAFRDRSMLLATIGQQRGVPNWKAFFLIYGGIAVALALIGLGLRLWVHVS